MGIKDLNKNELDILKRCERVFKTAKNGFIRGVYSSDINTVSPIYSKLGYALSNPSCNECVLLMFKQLGNIYFSNGESKNRKKKEGN